MVKALSKTGSRCDRAVYSARATVGGHSCVWSTQRAEVTHIPNWHARTQEQAALGADLLRYQARHERLTQSRAPCWKVCQDLIHQSGSTAPVFEPRRAFPRG